MLAINPFSYLFLLQLCESLSLFSCGSYHPSNEGPLSISMPSLDRFSSYICQLVTSLFYAKDGLRSVTILISYLAVALQFLVHFTMSRACINSSSAAQNSKSDVRWCCFFTACQDEDKLVTHLATFSPCPDIKPTSD